MQLCSICSIGALACFLSEILQCSWKVYLEDTSHGLQLSKQQQHCSKQLYSRSIKASTACTASSQPVICLMSPMQPLPCPTAAIQSCPAKTSCSQATQALRLQLQDSSMHMQLPQPDPTHMTSSEAALAKGLQTIDEILRKHKAMA